MSYEAAARYINSGELGNRQFEEEVFRTFACRDRHHREVTASRDVPVRRP